MIRHGSNDITPTVNMHLTLLKPPHSGFPAGSLVERHAGHSLAEAFVHYTCIGDLRQAPNLDAMPVVGLMEMSLRQRDGNKVLVVGSPFCKTGLKRQKALVLTNRMPILA